VRAAWKAFSRSITWLNTLAGYLSGVAIVVCAAILVYEVAVRYWLSWPTDWEIELAVILLIVATFMSAAFTQISRGHVGIEVLDSLMSARANYWRYLLGDLLSMAFCAFIAWKSWLFFHEAWVDGKMSNTVWGPKLWPAYFFMALGMSLLALQMLAQIGDQHLHAHREDEE
jgi:TRAP-type C4-dicarboxylate transport system permease small subunit